MRTAWLATLLAVCAGAATVGLEHAWAQRPCGEACSGLPSPACPDATCRDCRCAARRNLCPACRARLAGGQAFQGPLVPLAAQVSDIPFPRFHPVPTRPVFLPLWVGPPDTERLPEAPQPTLLKHLPPAAPPEPAPNGPQAKPHNGQPHPPSQGQPGAVRQPGSDGWRARSTVAVQTSWVFHPAVTAQWEVEPRDARAAGRTARQPQPAGSLR